MVNILAKPGKGDCFTDIAGLQVGHAQDTAVKSGVTVIVPSSPVAMGVDVRGGGPGTRDTDALDPTCLVDTVHGLVLAGGSVFGLAAADAVCAGLSEQNIGLPFGPRTIPVVPSAILFDLKNGGNKDWGAVPPYHRLGTEALAALGTKVAQGPVGAGYGATAGDKPGGIACASLETEDGLQVSAIVAVNSFGSVVENPNKNNGLIEIPTPGFVGTNTTIGAVATNITLDKAGCKRLAIMAQDGFARTIRPIHTPFDGDTIFALSTGAQSVTTANGNMAQTLTILGTLAADCVARAVLKAIQA
ncbi:MAG: P1 family peptidase [Kordiimonadaceae bacterium]|nr:P1 family peptidase [Kordiimonadaceae bacterium]